jgi:hypothetical protein
MRRVLMTALVGASVAALQAAPAAAAVDLTTGVTYVNTFNGQQCTGGGITTCYAPTLTQVGNGAPVPGSPGILRFSPDTSTGTGTTTNFSDWITQDPTTLHFLLNFSYTGSEVATYIGVHQGGDGLNNTCTNGCNTYQLFTNSSGITSGVIDLTYYFDNEQTGQISGVDLFDNGGAVPEPATWAMMLIGFAGVGMAMRRSRKANPALMQIA